MSSNLNHGKPLEENIKVFTQKFDEQAPMNRDQSMQMLPCRPISDNLDINAPRSSDGNMRPSFGSQRGSSWGLARSKEHPTNLPLLPRWNGFEYK